MTCPHKGATSGASAPDPSRPYGINVGDVADLIKTGIGGEAVSQVFIGERQYDMTVRFPPEARNSPEAIKDLVLTSSTGALIPLSQLSDIRVQTGESMINREMNHRYLLVKLNYHDRDPASLVAEVTKTIAEKVFGRSIVSNGADSSRASGAQRRVSS